MPACSAHVRLALLDVPLVSICHAMCAAVLLRSSLAVPPALPGRCALITHSARTLPHRSSLAMQSPCSTPCLVDVLLLPLPLRSSPAPVQRRSPRTQWCECGRHSRSILPRISALGTRFFVIVRVAIPSYRNLGDPCIGLAREWCRHVSLPPVRAGTLPLLPSTLELSW